MAVGPQMSNTNVPRSETASLRVALHNYFGRRWLLNIFGIVAATIAPGIYFWNDIAFSPDKFVEEWLKLIATTVLVAFVVEVVVARRDRSEARSLELRKLRRDYVGRVDHIIAGLRSLQRINTDDLEARDRIAANIHRDWRELMDRYHSEFVLDTPAHLTDKELEEIRLANYHQCQNLIDVALSTPPNLRQQRCQEAIDALQTIRINFDHAQTAEA